MIEAAVPARGPLSGPTGRRVAAHRDEVLEILGRYGSDLDLLIDLAPGTSLFDTAGTQIELADLLGVEVDLVPDCSLKERMRPRVERDAVAL